MNLKHRIGMIARSNSIIWELAKRVELLVFSRNRRQQDKHFGPLNPSVKFSVYRPERSHGLLAFYLSGLGYICISKHEGFTPIIDAENYRTQYNVDFPVNGTRNAWEYYFEQPCSYSLDEVYNSRNVRLSGWTLRRNILPFPPPSLEITDDMMRDAMRDAPVKKYIRDIAGEKVNHDGINEMIGVFVRGTDYALLKPSGHHIPPTAEQASLKLDEFLVRFGERKIFLATEDGNIYDFFKNKYGNMIYTTDHNLIRNYSGRDYLANIIDAGDRYKFGLDYLVKMICLSECKYLIASPAGGSRFARLLNNGRYEEEHIFSLGMY